MSAPNYLFFCSQSVLLGQSNRDDWQVEGEYDPTWPNDYEKVVIGEKI